MSMLIGCICLGKIRPLAVQPPGNPGAYMTSHLKFYEPAQASWSHGVVEAQISPDLVCMLVSRVVGANQGGFVRSTQNLTDQWVN